VDGSEVLTFGKHAGLTFQDVLTLHLKYCDWILHSTLSHSRFFKWLQGAAASPTTGPPAPRQMPMPAQSAAMSPPGPPDGREPALSDEPLPLGPPPAAESPAPPVAHAAPVDHGPTAEWVQFLFDRML